MDSYKQFFKDKKITVMGLGLLGRGLGYTKFLAECGADLIVTDLKTKKQLATSLKQLGKYKNIKYVLGEHRLEDFKNREMIVKAAGVPFDSIYIKEAKKNNIPIEMDVSLFAKLAPQVIIVGVTGTRGKSMTAMLIYEILSKNLKDKKVYLGGNIRGVATLPLLEKAKPGDVLVCELDSWQLQGFGDAKMSPHISIFTSFMPDHMNYYKNSMKDYFADKMNIFKYQKKNDFLIIRPHVEKLISKKVKSKIIVADVKKLVGFKFVVPGEHQRENLACAFEVARLFKIPIVKIKNTVKNFKGIEGRLQHLKTVRGIKIYNDNNATTPEATIAGIKALYQDGKEGKIVLISGGADKKLDLKLYVNVVNTFCKAIVLIPGSGTNVLLKDYKLKIPYVVGKDFKDAVLKGLDFTKKGDVLLFSPAFASFGIFNNEYERNDLFVKLINKLK
ncbi:MAG TPA: UDP-N-acetylmuramoyl-L-alanine--D-glutamate ligase [Candidatus Paceibacterota bacterium]|nr:UDP-N-acetylmuramoyl-L-alanine--D-glutamate ligase [Candidatus Paceibacterota bacterium]HPT18204.1 UDP-N-acetylmuramoyl-L-alanine--D-glutamate ligase [Candidatus Paceibacterota bacterium]